MRKGLISVLLLIAASLGVANASGGVGICLHMSTYCEGRLIPTLAARVSPRKLPANEYVPATWTIFGKFRTSGGGHPSALRQVDLDVDKDVRINSRHYPICDGGGRAIREGNPDALERDCARALIGRGKATIDLASPGTAPILLPSKLLVFNGGSRGGVTRLLIHAFIYIPAPTAIVSVITISKHGSALHTVLKIPVIAGGSGSLTDFKFKLGKTYSYKGKKVGYFEAKCPDGVFKANVEKLLFRNEAKVPGVAAQTELKGALAVPCTPQG
jgi:hypothetical protein